MSNSMGMSGLRLKYSSVRAASIIHVRYKNQSGHLNDMTNRNYVNGSNFERDVKKYFESKGYDTYRTAGSHGLVDIIAIPRLDSTNHPKLPILIQCKRSGRFPIDELETLYLANYEFAGYYILAEKQKGKIPLFCEIDGTVKKFE